jgi:hypothetical protein
VVKFMEINSVKHWNLKYLYKSFGIVVYIHVFWCGGKSISPYKCMLFSGTSINNLYYIWNVSSGSPLNIAPNVYLHEVTPSSLLCVVGLWLQTKFYLKFKATHPKHIIGERTFDGLKPFFVKPMKEWNTCCYIYHIWDGRITVGPKQYEGKILTSP